MSADTSIRTSGSAFRVVVLAGEHAVVYNNVHVKLDPGAGLLHLLDQSGAHHFLSVPISLAIVEWSDSSVLEPEPFLPTFGPGAYERMAKHVNELSANIGKAFR